MTASGMAYDLPMEKSHKVERVFYLSFPEGMWGTEAHVRYFITVSGAQKLEILIPGELTDLGT